MSRFLIHAREDQLFESGCVKPSGLALARCEHDQHALDVEPPGGEHERVHRRHVQPLRIVDQAQDRTLLRRRRK
jgi:hypothetical protein